MLTMPKNLPQPQLKPNTEVVLQKRYLRKDLSGKQVETPRDLLVPRRETWKSAFLTLLPDAS
ncbi:MAG: hypothetical protein PHW09_10600 [Desulfovibrio desulfuricans]|nr:hypothetical protein [Desulfovibrio desulfuricans]